MSNSKFISSDSVKRLIKDIKEIKYKPLTEHGIYYSHSEEDMLEASALIIGPQDTPYENGMYFFKIKYPANYPHSPPIFKYCTNDGKTRFNPNLYSNGKVCLSILNTWSGEQWSACQSISTVLLVLCTILHNKPLINEPGITESHHDFKKYNDILTFKNIDIAICNYFEDKIFQNTFPEFYEIAKQHFIDKHESILSFVNDYIHKNNITISYFVTTSIYNMNILIDYKSLVKRLNVIYHSLKN